MLSSGHAVSPTVMTDAGVHGCGRGLGAEHTAAELGYQSLDRHTLEEAVAAHRTAVDTAVGWSSLGSSWKSGLGGG